jgi:hypothetical protein
MALREEAPKTAVGWLTHLVGIVWPGGGQLAEGFFQQAPNRLDTRVSMDYRCKPDPWPSLSREI